jgi:hypothetical protein
VSDEHLDKLDVLLRHRPLSIPQASSPFADSSLSFRALSTTWGTPGSAIALDRRGHLMPGNEDQAAILLGAYLERSETVARVAQLGGRSKRCHR